MINWSKPIMKPFRWIFFPCRILLFQGKSKDFPLGYHISGSTFDVRADRQSTAQGTTLVAPAARPGAEPDHTVSLI